MQHYFKRFFVLHTLEAIFSFLIKKSRQKAIEIETAFFIPLGIQRITHWIISFTLHISVIAPLQTDPYINEVVEIFLQLSMKTVQVHLITWRTLSFIENNSHYQLIKQSYPTDRIIEFAKPILSSIK